MRKKRENGMAKESGMGDFPRKQFESVLLHSLRIMDQNREYLQMHLARTGDERTRQALEDMGQESIRLERTLREMMGLLEVEMNDKPSMKPVDLCWILMEAAQMAPEIEKQLDIRLTVDHSPFRRCYVKADAQEAEQLLFHLLSNALRAVSPGGQIKIRLTRDDEDLYLIVEDDGCGLPTGENWMENRRRAAALPPLLRPHGVGAFPHAARCRKRHPGGGAHPAGRNDVSHRGQRGTAHHPSGAHHC